MQNPSEIPSPEESPNTHTTHDEGTGASYEEYWKVIISMNPDQETKRKCKRIMERPDTNLKEDIVACIIEAMKTIQSYAQELPHAIPDRKAIVFSRVRALQALLATLLDAGVDGRPVSPGQDVLKMLEENHRDISRRLLKVICQLYGESQGEGLLELNGANA
jgi:hypothetical protein